MNNVWTAIAFRAPCVVRQPPRRPLLQLFNGYQRFIATIPRRTARLNKDQTRKHNYTTTAVLRYPRNRHVRQSQPAYNDFKLEAAPTEASHTEGAPAEDETPTWRDYDPEGGMPLPGGERAQTTINSIFGSETVDAETGNYILSVLHWRRLSGALIDSGIDFPPSSGVTREQSLRGIGYLRSLDQGFDEQAAGKVWAEEESLRLQGKLRERAVKLRLYKPEEAAEEEEPEDAEQSDQGTEYGRERNQDSALLRLREENIARQAILDARAQVRREQKEINALAQHRGPLQLSGGVQPPTSTQLIPGGGISITRPSQKAWLQPVERKSWVKHYEQQATLIKDNTIPQLSLLQRLGPSLVFLLFILGGAAYLSATYTPAPASARLFPDMKPTTATLTGLTAVLVTTFMLGRLPPLWRTFSKYFTLVPAYPYTASLIGATFRHDSLSHLATNLASLWLFGSILHEDVGRGSFLAIYLAAGAIGGYSSLVYQVLRRNWTSYIFGASNCVLGVLAAACVLRPNGTIQFMGYDVPIAAWVFLGLYGVGEVVAVVRGWKSTIDHVGHVGGMFGGFACAMWLRMRVASEAERGNETGAVMVERRVLEESEAIKLGR